MREIKFKIWDSDRHKMHDGIEITKECYCDIIADHSLNSLIWLEFTGLHDKNGKEIWEGDILKVESDMVGFMSGIPTGNKSVRFYTVVWVDEYSHFTTKREDGCIENGFGLRKEHSAKWFEVIGNIYENPELLKE